MNQSNGHSEPKISMTTSRQRKRVIRAAWKDRGSVYWDREVHGRGLEPLNIRAIKNSRAPKGRPSRTAPDNLEFRLERTIINGEPMATIICEGVVVETWPDRPI